MPTRWYIIRALIGAGAFGTLMALRTQVSGVAARTTIAALAFAVFGVVLVAMVGKRRG